MAILKMQTVVATQDADEFTIVRDGRKRRASRAAIVGDLDDRLRAIEQAPSVASLASRVGSLENWRNSKAAAIDDTPTDMSGTGVTVLGISVASNSAMQQKLSDHANRINSILSALRQREVISA